MQQLPAKSAVLGDLAAGMVIVAATAMIHVKLFAA